MREYFQKIRQNPQYLKGRCTIKIVGNLSNVSIETSRPSSRFIFHGLKPRLSLDLLNYFQFSRVF